MSPHSPNHVLRYQLTILQIVFRAQKGEGEINDSTLKAWVRFTCLKFAIATSLHNFISSTIYQKEILTDSLHGLPLEDLLVDVLCRQRLGDVHGGHGVGVAPEQEAGDVQPGEGGQPAGLETGPGNGNHKTSFWFLLEGAIASTMDGRTVAPYSL